MILYPYPAEVSLLEGKPDYASVRFLHDDALAQEEYFLKTTPTGVTVTCSSDEGAFRARATLAQLEQTQKEQCVSIHDFPAIPVRGIMLDISRSKIPSLATLCRLIDRFASLKINQLQLYMEGYPFAYAHYPEVWKDTTPLTPENIRFLDGYCRDRFIQLVPNQNCFGHMSLWLTKPEFNHLAECPDGFQFKWDHWAPTCLAPEDPESFQFVQNLFDDLLPNFSADTVNINCDETLELGQGKSKAICEARGTEQVYFDYLCKVIAYVKKYKKNVLFWGDIIAKAPELLKDLPENVTPINWGYAATTPKEENCKAFQALGLPFYNAPGTQTWCTILGNTEQMLANVDHAVRCTLAYGGKGLLMTDWGDLNHPQYLPFSYPGFAYASAMAWQKKPEQRELLTAYLDTFIFCDANRKFASVMLDAGRYQQQVDFSTTQRGFVIGLLFYPLEDKVMAEGLKNEEMVKLEKYLDTIEARLNGCALQCDDAACILDEFRNALRIMRFTAEAGRYKIGLYHGGTPESHKAYLKELQEPILAEHARLWRLRNAESDLAGSLARIRKV